jgi:putative ATPase
MADLWQARRDAAARAVEPLAVRMRPRTLDEIAGQQHILGPGKLLRRMLQADRLTSIILHGPPGTGKTTLAEVIARHLDRHFEKENASSVGVARIRQILDEAKARLGDNGKRTVLFLDEIHRFSKSQQDVLLSDVERGLITLIGATTENPLFAVNSALVSRSTLFRLEPLTEEDIILVLRRAIADSERGYGKLDLRVEDDALRVWAIKSDGDARRALTALEVAVLSNEKGGTGGSSARVAPAGRAPLADEPPVPPSVVVITRSDAEESIQQKAAVYDGTGDEHYDAASALIKSVRGSDPDAALYWMARMLEAGEDPRFIARRLAILASEDIGNADPRAIMVAAAAWELVERIGLPEARITLGQCITYLALAPKSNASYVAIEEALTDVREGRTVQIPQHIKDGNVRKASSMSAGGAGKPKGESYNYTHDEGIPSVLLGRVGAQDYLGVTKSYYRPTDHGAEKLLKERLEEAKRLREGRQ